MSKNTLKTWLFMAVMGVVLVSIGNLVGPWLFGKNAGARNSGMMLFLFIAVGMNFVSYWFSDRIVLKMTRSRPVTEQEAPWLYKIVGELTTKTGMPMPRLYVMPAPQPNAFATGRNPEHAAVAVTEGILSFLNEQELAGVLAHELSHVRNRDILIGAVAATAAAFVTMLARMLMFEQMFGGGGRDRRDAGPLGAFGALFAMILAPVAAFMIQMAVSRSREAQADRSGAELLGDATPLATALIKIDRAAKGTPQLAVNPAVSHLFLQSPLQGKGAARWFMSHPPLEERLAQLRELGAKV